MRGGRQGAERNAEEDGVDGDDGDGHEEDEADEDGDDDGFDDRTCCFACFLASPSSRIMASYKNALKLMRNMFPKYRFNIVQQKYIPLPFSLVPPSSSFVASGQGGAMCPDER